jgi:hypothetical protein
MTPKISKRTRRKCRRGRFEWVRRHMEGQPTPKFRQPMANFLQNDHNFVIGCHANCHRLPSICRRLPSICRRWHFLGVGFSGFFPRQHNKYFRTQITQI